MPLPFGRNHLPGDRQQQRKIEALNPAQQKTHPFGRQEADGVVKGNIKKRIVEIGDLAGQDIKIHSAVYK